VVVRELFEEHLPTTFTVAGGEAVDLFQSHSPQLDVVIFDSSRNFAFYEGNSVILPAEALLVSIEVKSKLTKDEISKSLKAAAKLRELRPFKKKLAPVRKDGESADGRCRYFHTIFAFDSDLKRADWLRSEYKRIGEVSAEENLDSALIDRIYIPNRGILNLPFQMGIEEADGSGSALIHYYMHTLNFLLRENARRQNVPYLEYAGRLSKDWVKL
jgi:hypothetical protein